jgi:hypothetical protein
VPDRKPPRLAGDDRATLLDLLQYQRDSFVRKVTGVDTEKAEISPVPSGTSLLWLTNHMADAEITWILQRFARRSDDEGPEAPGADLDGAVARYQRTWREVDTVVSTAVNLDVLCPPFDDQPSVNLRWILAHLLEETARHAGHADILRELLDGQTGR